MTAILTSIPTSTVYWCIASKFKVPLFCYFFFMQRIKRFCGWIHDFFQSVLLWRYYNDKKPTGYWRDYHSRCRPPRCHVGCHGAWRPHHERQATGLDAWASRVKYPARFVSHLHEICIYIWVVYSLCFFCCLFITVTWWYVWCIEWASGNQKEVQACLVTLWLFIISCYSLYKTTLGLLCSWFENNPHFHKYSMDFRV